MWRKQHIEKDAAHIFVFNCVSLRYGLKKSHLRRVDLNADILLAFFPAARATDLLSVYLLLHCIFIHNELEGNSDYFGRVLKLR